MNHTSSGKLAKINADNQRYRFKRFNDSVQKKTLSLIQTDPQALYNSLLNKAALKQIPAAAVNKIVPVLKSTLVDSLQSVFLYGLGFILIGVILAVFLGSVKLKQRSKEEKQEALLSAESH